MSFKDETLVFTENQIYFGEAEHDREEVMMDWEDSIMQTSANYVCQNGGDILEIGFGMGISANYIQANSINSHTIVEIHPDILNKAYEWAEGKDNVNVVAGDWYSSLSVLGTYDGIFYDAFGDTNLIHLKDTLDGLTKSGCKVTWWNNLSEENNSLGISGVTYEKIQITPPSNTYFNHEYYYLPKKEY
jgi:protein arginine N-methyltransferase 2